MSKQTPLLGAGALIAGLIVLFACQDNTEVSEPSALLATATHQLTVLAAGNGSGKVTSTPTGINCTITLGKTGASGCTKSFDATTTVTLKVTPAIDHAFSGWSSPVTTCTGIQSCKVKMGSDRTITATFNKGPFTIRISSVSPTGGTGKIRLQEGTTVRTCTITNGVLGSSASCLISAGAYRVITLTPIAAAGYAFNGWNLPSCGTATCQFQAVQSRTVPATFSAISAGNPAQQGRWDPPFTTPVVAVHMHQLATGKLLLWGDTGDAELWGAAAGFTLVPKPYRIYCTGHGFLPDGRLLVVGGTSPDTRGQRKAVLFNPASASWSNSGAMAQGRYYPTITTLANGSLLAVSGHDTNLTVVTIPEVYTSGGWKKLSTAPLSIPNPYYPPMFVAPNGKVFLAGFTQPSRYLDVTGTGQWTSVAARNVADRVLGSAVMYAPGKVLYVGGGKVQPFDGPPTASAEVIDLNQASPAWRSVSSMAFPRKQLNATILADGSVLVTGGTSGPGFNDQPGAVHAAELWHPETETWTTLASQQRNRTYHSTALLLASGRVISSGSGEGGDVPYTNAERSAEVFSPPYLFNPDGSLAARPAITSAPAQLSYGQSFSVETPDASAIARGTLIRASSVTHGFNQSQRLYPLTFSVAGSTTLSSVAPASGNLAPPGPYLLFLINTSGVPSTAKFVTVGP